MNDYERLEAALDILENAEVMQEFDDSIWLKISKEDWEWFKEEVIIRGVIFQF